MNRRNFVYKISTLIGGSIIPTTFFVGCSGDAPLEIDDYDLSSNYPITINHALGQTILEHKPQRILCLGTGAEDILLSLGITPIAIESNIWGGNIEGYLPWFYEEILSQNTNLPETIQMYPELDISKIIRLQPDLILATQSGISSPIYQQLSHICPFIAYPNQPWLTPLNQQISIISAAIGESDKGQALQTRIRAEKKAYLSTYPELQKYTFAYITSGSHQTNIYLYVTGDPRIDTLTSIGLKSGKYMSKAHPKKGSFVATLSLEQIDLLNDVDLIIAWFPSEAARQKLDNNPLFQLIPAIKNGAYLPLLDQSLIMAIAYNSPLSLSWAIKKLLPKLQKILPNAPTN